MVFLTGCHFAKTEVRSLYKNLIRKCEKLPTDEHKVYYKNFVRQGFRQHSDEIDQERIQQIIAQAKKDSNWILKKLSKMSNELMDVVRKRHENTEVTYDTIFDTVAKANNYCKFEVDVDTIRKYYYTASMVFCNPRMYNSKIFDSAVRRVGFSDYYSASFDQEGKQEELKALFEVPLEDKGIQYINEIKSQSISVLREIILRDGRRYDVIELWDLKNHGVILFPLNRFNKIANRWTESRLLPTDKYQPLVLSMNYVKSLYGEMKLVVNMIGYSSTDETFGVKFLDDMMAKIRKWAKEPVQVFNPSVNPYVKRSLTFVDPIKYYRRYTKLKRFHFKKLKEVWSTHQEKTNPEKFILEELGIAIYIDLYYINAPVKNFIDLGCGNGLLVLFLRLLGWEGYGIDCRRRNLWNVFNVNLELKEHTINPFDESLFKDADEHTLFIGNHPDQLTPWIPIMASRTKSKIFLLPCCAYAFNQARFDRKGIYNKDNLSVYRSYLDYVGKIALSVGYRIKFDRLRIPSTKRVCILGEFDTEAEICPLEETCYWEAIEPCKKMNFNEKLQEKVRNGTKLPRVEVEKIIYKIFRYLLDRSTESDLITYRSDFLHPWNRGARHVTLTHIIYNVLDDVERQLFKTQCKGIQTLVKNYSNIFSLNDGYLQLRIPYEEDVAALKNKTKLRVAPCYFYFNHPNSCPMPQENCRFDHDPIWGVKSLFDPTIALEDNHKEINNVNGQVKYVFESVGLESSGEY